MPPAWREIARSREARGAGIQRVGLHSDAAAEGKTGRGNRYRWAWDGRGAWATIVDVATGLAARGQNWENCVGQRRWGVARRGSGGKREERNGSRDGVRYGCKRRP